MVIVKQIDGQTDGRTDTFQQHSPQCMLTVLECSVKIASTGIASIGIVP